MYYALRVQGHLDPSWSDRFGGLRIEQQEAGTTLLSGSLPDQAALHGLLLQIVRLGLVLLSLETSEAPEGKGRRQTTWLIIERRVVTSDRVMSRLLLPGITRKTPAYGRTIENRLRMRRNLLCDSRKPYPTLNIS